MSKSVFIKTRILKIVTSELRGEEFIQLLAPWIKTLDLWKLTICSKAVTFSEMVEKIPNIEEITIYESTITINDQWLNDFMKFKKGNNFKSLIIRHIERDFDVESLITFIKVNFKINFNGTENIL
uniref:Uncharacterized protein n=1 Tax=Panagrolaimus sp. ES5 TaxID=591445 RepID=A0AC34FJB6_9BILA